MSMTDIPKTQKAWRAHRRGRPRQVVSLDDISVPTPGPKQALVKVEAVAMNAVGYKRMFMVPSFLASLPKIVEYDYTGHILLTGSSFSTAFKPGDRVWGMLDIAGKQGAMAEYILVSEEDCAVLPASLGAWSKEQAAGVGCVGMTGQQALFEAGHVERGDRVLVVGGSTSVGLIIIQMLKQLGCHVSTSCSAKNFELVKSVGADVVYDYTTSPLPQQLLAAQAPSSPQPFDMIVDCVGEYDVWRYCKKYLAPAGEFVVVGNTIKSLGDVPGEIWRMITAGWRGVGRKRIMMISTGGRAHLQALNDLIAKGGVVPVIDSIYEFKDVLDAYDRVMSDRARGKIVVRVSS